MTNRQTIRDRASEALDRARAFNEQPPKRANLVLGVGIVLLIQSLRHV